MKKLFILIPIICTSCTLLSSSQDTKSFVENLEKSQDPISVIETYIDVAGSCKSYYRTIQPDSYGINMVGNSVKNDLKTRCQKRQATAEPNINFKCLVYLNPDYSSDECILHRRTLHDTSVEYFDYKKFLPENSIIKTDEDFERLVKFYEKYYLSCDKYIDITTDEKQKCKENAKLGIRQAILKTEHCENFIKPYYEDFLSNFCNIFTFIERNKNDKSKVTQNIIKEYHEDIEKKVYSFGKDNFCSTENWEHTIQTIQCDK